MNFITDWTTRIDFDRIRRDRLERVRRMLAERDVAGLLTIKYENVRYITGMRPLWFPFPQLLYELWPTARPIASTWLGRLTWRLPLDFSSRGMSGRAIERVFPGANCRLTYFLNPSVAQIGPINRRV